MWTDIAVSELASDPDIKHQKALWHMQSMPDVLAKSNSVLGKRESKLWWCLVLINIVSDAIALRSFIDAFWIRSLLFLVAW